MLTLSKADMGTQHRCYNLLNIEDSSLLLGEVGDEEWCVMCTIFGRFMSMDVVEAYLSALGNGAKARAARNLVNNSGNFAQTFPAIQKISDQVMQRRADQRERSREPHPPPPPPGPPPAGTSG